MQRYKDMAKLREIEVFTVLSWASPLEKAAFRAELCTFVACRILIYGQRVIRLVLRQCAVRLRRRMNRGARRAACCFGGLRRILACGRRGPCATFSRIFRLRSAGKWPMNCSNWPRGARCSTYWDMPKRADSVGKCRRRCLAGYDKGGG